VGTGWVERYGERLEHERLPQGEVEQKLYANQVGADGWRLLAALDGPSTPDWMKTLPAITTLRQIWSHQFEPLEHGGGWLAEPVLAGAELINSPYEPRCAGGRETYHVLGR
jgi:transposase